MQLGWIDFSKSDRDKVVGILDLLSEQGVLDELGISQIRDGFANLFFPGTSTIQTRAKYFLMIPYIFKSLESNSKDPYKFKTELNELEKNCAKILIKKNENEIGIIGKRSIENGNWVKRHPSSIYWAGLKKYGIFRADFSIDQYIQTICSRNSAKENLSKLGNSNDRSDGGHDDEGSGDIQSFDFWKIPGYYNNWLYDLEMDLTKKEGEFLKEQIINSCPNSMLEFLLKNDPEDILEINSFSDLCKIKDKFPDELRTYFYLAKGFSDFNLVLRVLFNVIVADGKNKEFAEEVFDNKIEPNLDIISAIDLDPIFTLFDLSDELEDFLSNAQKCMKEKEIEKLKELIKEREVSLKGENRARTCHPEQSEDKWFAGGALDYRFSIAKSIILDIFKSEGSIAIEKLDMKEES